MNQGVIGQLALTFGLLSLISIGGASATIPEFHRQVVDVRHWMDAATFANVVAIGQAAPGPNVLIVGMIGWQIAGLAGLLTTMSAILLPSCLLAAAVGRALTRFAAVEWVGVMRRALGPIAVGFMLASGYVMSRASFEGALSVVIVVATAAMMVFTRRSPLFGIAAGALLGILGQRLHAFG